MQFEKLVQLPESQRDQRWESEFLDGILSQKVSVIENGEPVAGPEGWPYLRIKTGEGEEPFVQIARWLASRGIGLVVNAHKMTPDYVFTFGMLWNFLETGRFVEPSLPPAAGAVDFSERPVQGPPTEKYLPSYVRSILREFLKDQELNDVKILVASSRDFAQTDLVFSLESLGSIDSKDQRSLAQALSWFLPLHYSIVFAQEQNLKGWSSL